MSALLNPQFWLFVGAIAGIYAIFALGLQIQFGFTGLLNFGHVASMAIAAYTMAILVVRYEVNLWLASLVAVVASMLFALLIGLPTLRLRSDYFAITTIAFSEIVRHLALNLQDFTGGAVGSVNLLGAGKVATYSTEWNPIMFSVQDPLANIFGDVVDKNFTMLVIVWTVMLILLVIMEFLVRSPWGRVIKSIREDEDAAAALGKNPLWYKLQSLAIGSALGAVAGLFYAFQFSFFGPSDFEPLLTFFAYVIVILGGTGRNLGVPLGALIFGVIFAGTRFFEFPPFSWFEGAEAAYLRLVIIGLILILLMAFRPQGILGRREELALEQ